MVWHLWLVWILLLSALSCHIIRVNHFHFWCIFVYCFLNSSSTCAIWIWDNSITQLYYFAISFTQCKLVYVFCEYIVCFTPKLLLCFQHCLIILYTRFVVFEFNFTFYFALLCILCLLINSATIYKITVHLWFQCHKLFHYSFTQFVFQ